MQLMRLWKHGISYLLKRKKVKIYTSIFRLFYINTQL